MFKSSRVFEGDFVHVDKVQTGRARADEIVGTKGSQFSVGVLVYSPEVDMVFVVTQERTAMRTDDNRTGEITEVVAGRCDVENEPIVATIVRELEEELGVAVKPEDIELLTVKPQAMSPGILKEKMYLAFCELKPSSVIAEGQVFGLKEDGEETRVEGIPVDDVEVYLAEQCQDLKTWALLQWFLNYLRWQQSEDNSDFLLGQVNDQFGA